MTVPVTEERGYSGRHQERGKRPMYDVLRRLPYAQWLPEHDEWLFLNEVATGERIGVAMHNVADSLQEPLKDFVGTDFPASVPPWTRCWVEFEAYKMRIGCMVNTSYSADPPPWPRGPLVDPAAHWTAEILGWARLLSGEEVKHIGAYAIHAGSEGQPVRVSYGRGGFTEEVWPGRAFIPRVIAMGFSLANCANARIVTERLPRAARRRFARGGDVLGDTVFRTLRVLPLHASGRAEVAAAHASGVRHHICRGHFKDYRNGPGLFGKMPRLYWWDAFWRGDPEIGRVHKDYSVECDQ